MGASVIKNYESLAFYEARTRSGISRRLRDRTTIHVISHNEKRIRNMTPRLLQLQEIHVLPAREAGKTVDSLNKRQAYMTKYQLFWV